MLRSVKDLTSYYLHAMDGAAGPVKDVYFDDLFWTVRYLVCDSGRWLPGRQVLVAPVALGKPDSLLKRIPVSLTLDQIRKSPSIDADRPVSRQEEETLATYYRWPVYWGGLDEPSAAMTAGAPSLAAAERDRATLIEERGNPRLRSFREVRKYGIQAQDADVGHLEDFLVDDAEWRLRFAVVDTTHWRPGGRVLVPVGAIQEVRWTDNRVRIALPVERIRNSPPFDPSSPENLELEERWYDYYGRPSA